MIAPDSIRSAFGRLSWLGKADAAALAGFAILLSAMLWPAWIHNPDLTHGLLMPVVFVLLLRESRRSGTQRTLRIGPGAIALLLCLTLAAFALLAVAGLYAAVITWSNGLVQFLSATSLALMLSAGLVAFADERVRLVPFNWNAIVAVWLWPLSAPIPPGTYTRLAISLQLWISSGVMDVLQILGVAAHRQGNIIELATGSVGVAEACSGVRSLVSCVFVAFLFSASLVSRPRARAVVIVAAAPLALAMNFIRSLGLTLLANARVDISGFWHDATGFAVLGVTAALLGGLAVGLGAEAPDRPPGGRPASPVSPSRSRAAQASLAAILALAAALVSFYGARTHPVVRRDSSGPDLQAMLPGAPPGWTAFDAHDLSQYSGVLQTDLLSQRVYVSGAGDSRVQVTLYMAYWPPGRIPVSTVDAHTPDACWPAEGWLAKALANPEAGFSVGSRQLAPAEARVFTSMGAQQYVWFWHLYAGRPIPYQNPYSLRELASSAWHYGFRRGGDQLFVSVASNRPWDEIADLAILRQFFANTQPLGL